MILIIGYGNALRGDDGVGCVVARMLEQRLDDVDLQVQTVHQLTPELVATIAGAQAVVFIDARDGGSAGEMTIDQVLPHTRDDAFTHNVDPSGLIGAAQDWYGVSPQAWLISITGNSFDFSDALSQELTACLPHILDTAESFFHKQVLLGVR